MSQIAVGRRAQLRGLLRAAPSLLRGRAIHSAGPLRVRFVYQQLGASTRYRVLHQMEQARLAGFVVQDSPLDRTAELYDVGACDVLYLYRLALTSRTWPLLVLARRYGIATVFDSDDLVWDERERSYNFLDDHHSPAAVAAILRGARRMRAMMRRVDGFVFSTSFLAQLAQQSFAQPVFVNQNALGQEQIATAAAAFAERTAASEDVIVGYFCGTPGVHDEDFASIAPALATVLAQRPNVRLRLYGEVALPQALATAFGQRIERRIAVPWAQLSQHLAQVDINIAPLVDNPQRRAKSAVKYLEAALLRVPTVAARLDPYSEVMVNGATGMLAWSPVEWVAALMRLVDDSAERRRLGEAAYNDVVAAHTTMARAAGFAAIMESLRSHQTSMG